MNDHTLESLKVISKVDPEKGRSKIISPGPLRKKFVTEILAALSENRLSFASVMKMDPKKIRQLAEQGYVKLKYGRYEDARKIFEILTFVDHRNYFHHLALGGAYSKLKKHLDAAFQYSECLKYDPSNTNALVNRGEIFLKHKNFKKAAQDFREAILQDKEGHDIFANRARSLVIAIKRSIAKAKGEKAIKLPNSPSKRKKISPLKLMTSRRSSTKSKKK